MRYNFLNLNNFRDMNNSIFNSIDFNQLRYFNITIHSFLHDFLNNLKFLNDPLNWNHFFYNCGHLHRFFINVRNNFFKFPNFNLRNKFINNTIYFYNLQSFFPQRYNFFYQLRFDHKLFNSVDKRNHFLDPHINRFLNLNRHDYRLVDVYYLRLSMHIRNDLFNIDLFGLFSSFSHYTVLDNIMNVFTNFDYLIMHNFL